MVFMWYWGPPVDRPLCFPYGKYSSEQDFACCGLVSICGATRLKQIGTSFRTLTWGTIEGQFVGPRTSSNHTYVFVNRFVMKK